MQFNLKIYAVGGTIDKVYFDRPGQYQIGDPEIGKILEEGNIRFSYQIASICHKDSLEMSDEDRGTIRDEILKDDHTHILITHGTDTMIKTAQVLQSVPGKTIVLTGSMQPAKFKGSDATFNVGYAVAAVQVLPPGVYIAMNGQLFDPTQTRKNIEQNCFEKTG
ncbi:MAG: asparaginase [Deltaproteobacteria bacterium]|nr:asparaginase [Deltaproteobacteria bacterium]MBT4262977.1 asparaginase [Deltaproteobacteria bacterium]MBT4638966.1 asparaginase [Deltaproteobacteria bacterium]MBT6504755.1 asparaginase [Deltaproteobacteria bacterium]MBT6612758.1 asparaginase [Deltaproteobacteria bacterium]